MMNKLILRRPTQDELDTICRDSWVSSFVGSSGKPRGLARWMWARAVHAIVTELLAKHSVLVATLDGVDDEVIGWVCWEPPGDGHRWCLHYCWVKGYAKGCGVDDELMKAATSDIDDSGAQCSFRTPALRQMMEAVHAAE